MNNINFKIRRARRGEVANINSLLVQYKLPPIDASYVNARDISLVAVDDSGRIIGFIYVGLMRQNKQAYVDYFTVDANYSRQGVGKALAFEGLARLNKLGVEEVFGIIGNHEFQTRSAMNALKVAMGSDGLTYTQVKGQIKHMIAELKGAL